MTRTATVHLEVNGRSYESAVAPRRTLSDFLRDDLGLKGTHVGCEHGVCGACTIILNGDAVRSCLLFAIQVDGAKICTVEGLSTGEELHPLQEAFRSAQAFQCGFCTPGFLMSLSAFLKENKNPTDDEIRVAASSNLCRCTGYVPILEAVKQAAEKLSSGREDGSEYTPRISSNV